jgi:wobble nucleotide-excising tRNase
MLKRISHIKNVGAFQDCQARPVGFEKITLIYGRNTYGKSTLGDIFSSLQTNDPASILARASIPGTEDGQLVDMGFALDGENERGGQSLFRQGVWERGLIDSHLLRVYDDAFFHEHVFAARKFTRDTKVKFSDFILGSQGVAAAQKIGQKKQEKRQLNTRKNALIRDALNNIESLDNFVAMAPPESVDALTLERDRLREEHSTLTRQKREAGAIRIRNNLAVIDFGSQLEEGAAQLNQLLQTSIETHHEAAKAQLDSHICDHLQRADGAARWIQQGLGFNNGNNCSFCGQTYGDDAQALLNAYQQCFNDEYERHERFVTQEIERFQPMIAVTPPAPGNPVFEQNDLVLQMYPELANNADYQALLEQYQSSKNELLVLAQSATVPLTAINELFQQALILKKARPHQAIDVIDAADVVALVASVKAVVTIINESVEALNQSFNTFKDGINDADIDKRQESITAQGQSVAKQILRFEKREACTEFEQVNATLTALDAEIPQLEIALRDEQSDYLDNFYGTINHYFTALGSHEFVLHRGLNNSGHQPVYFLKVKFRGKDVSEVDLHKVFSESDRRALALSIFLSSLDAMSVEDLAKTVIVFDDPVTSFDDHRVTQTHMKMMEQSERCEKIILLSHFKEGIAQFLQTHAFGNQHSIKLIKITKDANSSSFEAGDINSFLLTLHDECREDIIDFIERREERLKYRPRVFLEAELAYRFGKQIREHNVSNDSLSQRIGELQENGVISEAVSIQLHSWREALNPEHHVFPGNDVEDQRTTARAFLQFVFHDLVPAN